MATGGSIVLFGKAMKKTMKYLVLGSLGLIIAFVAVLIFAIVGPRPDAVEGTDRPSWMPVAATDIFYRSQEGFGWWKAAEFTISESDFRAFAAKEGWSLTEEADYSRCGHLALIGPTGVNSQSTTSAPFPTHSCMSGGLATTVVLPLRLIL